MKRLYLLLILIIVVVVGLVPISTAQEIKPPVPKRDVLNSRHAEMQSRMRTMMMWRLVEYLDLNEDQSAKLFPLMKESNEIRSELIKERRELIHKIRKDIEDESVPIKDLKKQIKELEKINVEMLQERKRFLEKSEKILEERQYIKLILFEDRLKEDLFKRLKVREFRGKNNKKE